VSRSSEWPARATVLRLSRSISKWLGAIWQADDSVHPVPGATLIEPELGQQARLLPVVGTPNAAAEKDAAAVAFACA
jgi:hypothetical protein